MEKRTILALVFAIVFIIAWQKLVVEKYVKKHTHEVTKNLSVKKIQRNVAVKETEKKSNVLEEEKKKDIALSCFENSNNAVEEKQFTLENSCIKIVFSNRGAVARNIILKKYRGKSGDLYDLVNKTLKKYYPFTLFLKGKPLDNVYFKCIKNGSTLVFNYTFKGGEITKTFTLKKDYILDVEIKGGDFAVSLGAGLDSSEKAKSRYSTQDEIAYFYDGKVRRIKKKKILKATIPLDSKWIAIENRYFAKILTPSKKFSFLKPELYTYKENGKSYSLCSLRVGFKNEFKGEFFLGPKEYERLGELGESYKGLVNFGWFGAFGKWLFILLKWINMFVGNWGWSIVIFTILVRIILFPLNSAGLKSAQKMKELQPKVKAIQEKYKKYGNDMTMKAKMNQELQELYKREGVNPLGGCLPMLVQIPIFFAIYSLLLNIIDLRMAPWILWIKDLSSYDPYFVLPIAMGITQLVVQLLTPATGDKNQQRMMLIMPVVITFVLIYAPSGLLLYWTTNNIFQIFQQIILNKQMKTV